MPRPRPSRPPVEDAALPPVDSPEAAALIAGALARTRSREEPSALRDLLCRYAGVDGAEVYDVAAHLGRDHPVTEAFRRAAQRDTRERLRRARARDVAEVTRAADRRTPRPRAR